MSDPKKQAIAFEIVRTALIADAVSGGHGTPASVRRRVTEDTPVAEVLEGTGPGAALAGQIDLACTYLGFAPAPSGMIVTTGDIAAIVARHLPVRVYRCTDDVERHTWTEKGNGFCRIDDTELVEILT